MEEREEQARTIFGEPGRIKRLIKRIGPDREADTTEKPEEKDEWEVLSERAVAGDAAAAILVSEDMKHVDWDMSDEEAAHITGLADRTWLEHSGNLLDSALNGDETAKAMLFVLYDRDIITNENRQVEDITDGVAPGSSEEPPDDEDSFLIGGIGPTLPLH